MLCLSSIAESLDAQIPPVTVHNVAHLRDEADAIALFEVEVPKAAIVVVKLHGGVKSLPGFTRLVQLAERHHAWLVAMSGTDDLDPELIAYSTAGVAISHEAKAYLQLGGLDNYRHCLAFLCDHLLATGIGYEPPLPQPRSGIHHPRVPSGAYEDWLRRADPSKPTIGITFYRAYWVSGDTDFIDTLVEAGEALGANVLAVYAYSLKDEAGDDGVQPAMRFFRDAEGRAAVDAIVNTMAFAMGSSSAEERGDAEWATSFLQALDVPQLQAFNISISSERWRELESGLPPLDVAMNVAIPELDGRIMTVPASFKEPGPAATGSGSGVVRRRALRERADRIMGIAVRYAMLRRTPNARKRIAVILTNHHAKAARIANAVGLDAPASLLELLRRMADAGYDVRELPATADELMQQIIDRGHYDNDYLTEEQLAHAAHTVKPEIYAAWLAALPERRRAEMHAQWGASPGAHYVDRTGAIALAGRIFGNIFVAVQPPRGYGMDKTAIMHKPDFPPPYPYHALYRWLAEPVERGGFGADAIVQLGKHGSLEWLPGKGIGLSADCYPDLFLGDLPLVYPFAVDGAGEGAAAKRRAHATIVDHLTPPTTTVGALLRRDAGDGHTHDWDAREHADGVPYTISDLSGFAFAHLVEAIHTYTHELSAAPIVAGLHVLGDAPAGEVLIDQLAMLVRLPNGPVPSLRRGIAEAYGFDLGSAVAKPGVEAGPGSEALAADAGIQIRSAADAIDAVDALTRKLLVDVSEAESDEGAIDIVCARALTQASDAHGLRAVRETLAFVCRKLVPALRRTGDEIDNTLGALAGRFVPPGPSGAPFRGTRP